MAAAASCLDFIAAFSGKCRSRLSDLEGGPAIDFGPSAKAIQQGRDNLSTNRAVTIGEPCAGERALTSTSKHMLRLGRGRL